MMPKKVLLLTTGLLVSANSGAAIDANPQLSMSGDNIKLTIPGDNRGGNIRFYIDMDNNPETGSTNQESGLAGADFYIENDIIYAAAGDTWEYVSGDLISFSNEKENLELNISTATFDTLANNTSLLNSENKIDGFNGTVKMNIVTLDNKWNVVDTSGPTEYNVLDIEIPVADETPASESIAMPEPVATELEQAAEPVITEAPSSEIETNTETESSTDVANSNATEEVTETRRERRKRLRKERRKAKRMKRQARKQRQKERRQKRRAERLAANRNTSQN